MDKRELLERVKQQLAAAFGRRLKGVILYGSEARGDAAPESDIDFLVLLDGPIRLWADTRLIVTALYPLQLELLRPIHAIPVNARKYKTRRLPLYCDAQDEGIAA
ncbi:MAG: nucleotidyltransferase domain-containing protein [Pseudomonadota bacterium]